MEDVIRELGLSRSSPVNALVVFVGFALGAMLVHLLMVRGLKRLARSTESTVDDEVVDALRRPVFLFVLLLGAVESTRIAGLSPRLVHYAGGTFYSLMVAIAGLAAIRLSNLLTEKALLRAADMTGLGKDVIPFLENVWKIVIVVAVVMFILSIWDVSVTPLLASAGIAGVAVALAAKDTLSNFFGGISVFVDRPYKVGDYIVLDNGDRGEVVEIGIRSTRIKTRDDVLVTVPNSIIANTKIINESAPIPNYRVRVPVGVAYGSDIDLVEETLLAVAGDNAHILEEPVPRVRFRAFGDSALHFELLCWAREPALRGIAIHEMNCAVYKRFAKNGIVIPFPQRDVHVHGRNGRTEFPPGSPG